jgi:hypothetical protein
MGITSFNIAHGGAVRAPPIGEALDEHTILK